MEYREQNAFRGKKVPKERVVLDDLIGKQIKKDPLDYAMEEIEMKMGDIDLTEADNLNIVTPAL